MGRGTVLAFAHMTHSKGSQAMEPIHISIPWTEIERRRERLAAARQRFEYVDRVPVQLGIASRFWLHQFGRTWAEYASDPRTMLELQLRAHKWILENVPGDMLGVAIAPDMFSFYGESYALGCELDYDELTPWIRSHPVHNEDDLRRLERIDPLDNRRTEAVAQWMIGMEQYIDDCQLCYADGVLEPLANRLGLGWGSIGVFTLATDLRGPDIYLDLYERPDFAHQLLEIVTDKVIGHYRWLASITENPVGRHRWGPKLKAIKDRRGTGLVDDSAGALSPRLYREFVYPYSMRVVEAVGRPLSIHIDAPADHLLPFYREMGVRSFPGFGWRTSLGKVREYLGGQAALIGNLSPMLLLYGTPNRVYNAAWRVLDTLAPCGGLVLSEGDNVAPGTPVANMQAMVQAAEDYGVPNARSTLH